METINIEYIEYIVDYREKINGESNPNFKKTVQVKANSIEEKDLIRVKNDYQEAEAGKTGQRKNIAYLYTDKGKITAVTKWNGEEYFLNADTPPVWGTFQKKNGQTIFVAQKDKNVQLYLSSQFAREVKAGTAIYDPNAVSVGTHNFMQKLTAISPTAGAIGRGMLTLGRVTSGPLRALWNLARENPKVAAVIGAIAALGAGAYVWGSNGDIETPSSAETPAGTPAESATGLSVGEVDELVNLVKKYENSPEPEMKAEADKAKETLRKAGVPSF